MRIITLSGAPASGKTTVGKLLGETLQIPFVSAGQTMRHFARDRGVSVLEFGKIARKNIAYDQQVDDGLRSLASDNQPVIVDSRMGWHFIPESLSCLFVVDPWVAAERAEARAGQTSEEYADEASAFAGTVQRNNRDRLRFQQLYGVDIGRLRNYDLVIDTTRADPLEAARIIRDACRGERANSSAPSLWIDPKRIYPTESIRTLRSIDDPSMDELADGQFLSANPVVVSYSSPHFLLLDGHKRLSACIMRGLTLIPAELAGEDSDAIWSGRTADELQREAFENPTNIYDWESAHQLRLWVPPR